MIVSLPLSLTQFSASCALTASYLLSNDFSCLPSSSFYNICALIYDGPPAISVHPPSALQVPAFV
jgi:hypothetical protein